MINKGIKGIIKKKGLIQRMTMPLPELEHYYREQRKERFENNALFRGQKVRCMLHPVMMKGLKILHLLKKQKITIIGDQHRSNGRPIIFAATHIGWDDIEMIFSAIGTHAYLFWGDPRAAYKSLDGCLLDMNGVIICDTGHKLDRHIGKESCVRWLELGGNILIFRKGYGIFQKTNWFCICLTGLLKWQSVQEPILSQ